jgi:hypothetical protein
MFPSIFTDKSYPQLPISYPQGIEVIHKLYTFYTHTHMPNLNKTPISIYMIIL